MASAVEQLSLDVVAESLRATLIESAGWVVIDRIDDLSPGIGSSRVFRVTATTFGKGADGAASYILKVPDWGAPTLVQPDDPLVPYRERLFIESGIAEWIPAGMRVPKVLGIDRVGERTWLWMEDVGPAVAITWNEELVAYAARRNALLHETYLRKQSALAELEWLQKHHYAAYAHHVPAAHRNLDACRAHRLWSGLFSQYEIQELHDALARSADAVRELRTLPVTLTHGDFHIQNLGFDSDGTLVALDWAHIGIGPLGGDVATLSSLYHAMGGVSSSDGQRLERTLIRAYTEELERRTGQDQIAALVERVCTLWHRTWGLHLRLGPGLTALLRDEHDAPWKRRTADDIYEGCARVIGDLK